MVGEVAADLISRARAGDGEAFRELTEPYRRELQVHCYRMLGSFQDAEDALQDTLLAAWQGFGGFEGRASLRTWLYRIATNRCLNARRSASRRPAKEWDMPNVEPPEPTRLGEVVWLEPFPDALLEGGDRRAARPGGPLRADRIHLPGLRDRPSGPAAPPARGAHPARRPRVPRQRGGRACWTRPSSRSKAPSNGRAPACSSDGPRPTTANRRPPPGHPPRMRSWRSSSAHGSPPISTRWWPCSPTTSSCQCRRCPSNTRAGTSWPASAPASSARAAGSDLVPTRANGQPAFGTYLRTPGGISHGTGLYVLTLTGDRICAMTRFENSVLPSFGLPRSLPSP